MCVADRQLKLRQRSDLKIFTCFFKGSVHTAHIFLFLPLMVFSHVDVWSQSLEIRVPLQPQHNTTEQNMLLCRSNG